MKIIKKPFRVILLILTIALFPSCGDVTKKAEEKINELNSKTERLDSLVNKEVNKVMVLDSIITLESTKIKKIDSLVNKSHSKIDSIANGKIKSLKESLNK